MALVQHDLCPTKGTSGLSADVHRGTDVRRGPQGGGGPGKVACRGAVQAKQEPRITSSHRAAGPGADSAPQPPAGPTLLTP